MRSTSKVIGLLAGVSVALLAACSGTEATAPTEEHPAIPFLTESNSNCAVWSCSSGQCAQDPAIYGACCTTITDPGETGAPKPANCDAPPGGGSRPNWCGTTARAGCLIRRREDTSFYEDCSSSAYDGPSSDAVFSECQAN